MKALKDRLIGVVIGVILVLGYFLVQSTLTRLDRLETVLYGLIGQLK